MATSADIVRDLKVLGVLRAEDAGELHPDKYRAVHGKCPPGYRFDGKKCVEGDAGAQDEPKANEPGQAPDKGKDEPDKDKATRAIPKAKPPVAAAAGGATKATPKLASPFGQKIPTSKPAEPAKDEPAAEPEKPKTPSKLAKGMADLQKALAKTDPAMPARGEPAKEPAKAEPAKEPVKEPEEPPVDHNKAADAVGAIANGEKPSTADEPKMKASDVDTPIDARKYADEYSEVDEDGNITVATPPTPKKTDGKKRQTILGGIIDFVKDAISGVLKSFGDAVKGFAMFMLGGDASKRKKGAAHKPAPVPGEKPEAPDDEAKIAQAAQEAAGDRPVDINPGEEDDSGLLAIEHTDLHNGKKTKAWGEVKKAFDGDEKAANAGAALMMMAAGHDPEDLKSDGMLDDETLAAMKDTFGFEPSHGQKRAKELAKDDPRLAKAREGITALKKSTMKEITTNLSKTGQKAIFVAPGQYDTTAEPERNPADFAEPDKAAQSGTRAIRKPAPKAADAGATRATRAVKKAVPAPAPAASGTRAFGAQQASVFRSGVVLREGVAVGRAMLDDRAARRARRRVS